MDLVNLRKIIFEGFSAGMILFKMCICKPLTWHYIPLLQGLNYHRPVFEYILNRFNLHHFPAKNKHFHKFSYNIFILQKVIFIEQSLFLILTSLIYHEQSFLGVNCCNIVSQGAKLMKHLDLSCFSFLMYKAMSLHTTTSAAVLQFV